MTEATAAELFYLTAECVENLSQCFPSRNPLEHLHFSREQILRPFQIVDVNLERYIADDVALCVEDGDAPCARPPIGAVRVEHAKLLVEHLARRQQGRESAVDCLEVIYVDDARLSRLRQPLLGHIEVLDGLLVAEIRYAGRIQEPRLPGQHVKKTTQAAIK